MSFCILYPTINQIVLFVHEMMAGSKRKTLRVAEKKKPLPVTVLSGFLVSRAEKPLQEKTNCDDRC